MMTDCRFVAQGHIHAQGHSPVEWAEEKLPWTLDSVRDGRLWNVTRNLLRTSSLKFLSVLKSPLGIDPHTFRRVADDASKAEAALSGSSDLLSTNLQSNIRTFRTSIQYTVQLSGA